MKATKVNIYFSWVGLVSKNYEIERACVELEQDVQQFERQRKRLRRE